MNLELSDKESKILLHAIEVYLSDLREEIVKAEKHEWKVGLHDEQEVLKGLLKKLS